MQQTIALADAVFRLMFDQLGAGIPELMPDMNALLADAKINDAINESFAVDKHNESAGRLAAVAKDLGIQDKAIADKVADAAQENATLTEFLRNTVQGLKKTISSLHPGKLPRIMETALICHIAAVLQQAGERYNAVASGNNERGGQMAPLSLTRLKEIVSGGKSELTPKDLKRLAEYLPYINEAMLEGGITSPKRQAAFLAQIIHETDDLKTLEEYSEGPGYFDNYEGGADFHGRGAIQLTHRSNYAEAGKALDLPLTQKPDLAKKPEHAFDIAQWYWNENNLNDPADDSEFKKITKAINGGYTGEADREQLYDRARKTLDAD
ncbi:glycoside hydrolase family 19 protein [Nocardia sp. NPDC019395]|uniref:glycoside hydrolase family 19 protein n=1 Tax=Nocardia sp. NPDC019395 TaxID=3154686 RepID=UPI0033DD97C8